VTQPGAAQSPSGAGKVTQYAGAAPWLNKITDFNSLLSSKNTQTGTFVNYDSVGTLASAGATVKQFVANVAEAQTAFGVYQDFLNHMHDSVNKAFTDQHAADQST
jgi:hypothetical protein